MIENSLNILHKKWQRRFVCSVFTFEAKIANRSLALAMCDVPTERTILTELQIVARDEYSCANTRESYDVVI